MSRGGFQIDWLSAPETRRQSRAARDAGMLASVNHADRVERSWSTNAYALLKEYCKTHPTFMGEDVRHWAHGDRMLPTPPDSRAWGSLFNRAAREGIIVRVGYAPQRDPKAHRAPKSVWRAT